MPPTSLSVKSRRVAVIGAGAEGLVAARELRREGHSVVVFERGSEVGGTWVYTPRVETDPLGLDPNRPIVHTSLYSSLRTNLPREVMGFRDFPFVARPGENRDPRMYPGHREVLMYLKDFAREFGIEEMVRFEREVVKVGMLEKGKWKVRSKKTSSFTNENTIVLILLIKVKLNSTMRFTMLSLFVMDVTPSLVLPKFQASIYGQEIKCIATITAFLSPSEIKL